MRYDDWDVILFPAGRDAKIPFKEFKVACHVVPDLELSHIHGAASSMPVMTCFIPSLTAGNAFQISIHNWKHPKISAFTRAYSKHTDLVRFEARVLLDGRFVASAVFDREFNGPKLVTNTFEFTKTGEIERLRFPVFRRELLFQSHWNPGDDVGRIKVVISEGFPRDSLSVPIERVKNVVCFSFQHAPIEILESTGIAWPNPSMWRRTITPQLDNSNSGSPMPGSVVVPTYNMDDGGESHAHSPRRKNMFLRNVKSQGGFPMTMGSPLLGQQQQAFSQMTPTSSTYFARNSGQGFGTGPGGLFGLQPAQDPFTEGAYLEWVAANITNQCGGRTDSTGLWPGVMGSAQRNNGFGRQQQGSSADSSMHDYAFPVTNLHGHCGESMNISSDGMGSSDDVLMSVGKIGGMKAPTNTPITGAGEGFDQLGVSDIGGGSSLWAHNYLNNNHQAVKQLPIGVQQENFMRARLGLAGGFMDVQSQSPMLGEIRGGDGGIRGGDGGIRGGGESSGGARKFSQNQVDDGLDHSPLSSDSGESVLEDKNAGGGVAIGGRENVAPAVFSGNCSRNASGEILTTTGGVGLLAETTNIGGGGSGGGGGTKRTRNFTPASARAIDEEDEPRRVSPRMRIAGFGVDVGDGSGGGAGEECS
ncbi:hypothetical protein QBC43DRAFT_79194 [Cladorrhinum sp. PSN259]|nr:hypothetical protein QBC43DRAFT_79194 [Cladorrhinum sp. PSN259]